MQQADELKNPSSNAYTFAKSRRHVRLNSLICFKGKPTNSWCSANSSLNRQQKGSLEEKKKAHIIVWIVASPLAGDGCS